MSHHFLIGHSFLQQRSNKILAFLGRIIAERLAGQFCGSVLRLVIRQTLPALAFDRPGNRRFIRIDTARRSGPHFKTHRAGVGQFKVG